MDKRVAISASISLHLFGGWPGIQTGKVIEIRIHCALFFLLLLLNALTLNLYVSMCECTSISMAIVYARVTLLDGGDRRLVVCAAWKVREVHDIDARLVAAVAVAARLSAQSSGVGF